MIWLIVTNEGTTIMAHHDTFLVIWGAGFSISFFSADLLAQEMMPNWLMTHSW
jgi:hypothetical protein